MRMKPPTKVKEVRRFIDMCVSYRKHIQNFAKIAAPLTNLTRSNVEFKWTQECQQSFETRKSKLVETNVLAKANFSKKVYSYH